MNRREQLAKDNGMTIEFVNWFFDNKKDGCGNAWLVMMAAMWESWKHLSEQRDALAAENAALREKMGQLSIEESQFLTDVLTAAGLLAYGKQDKGLARRIADFCVSKRGNSNSAQLRKGGAA